MADPYAGLRVKLEERAFAGKGRTTPDLRRRAAQGGALPVDLDAYTRKVRDQAYLITDEEVAALSHRHDDDTLFEVTIAAALGAAFDRLDRGLATIEALEMDDAS